MLFFVKAESKSFVPLPIEQILNLQIKEWEAVVRYQQQGKVLAGGSMTGRKGGCAIWNADSLDEMDTLITQLPMFPFVDWEVIPLNTPEYALKSAKQAMAEFESQSK